MRCKSSLYSDIQYPNKMWHISSMNQKLVLCILHIPPVVTIEAIKYVTLT